MDIVGKTIQNGEPTPEHPIDIENKINLTGAIQILNKLKSKVTLVKVDDENNSEKEYRLPFLMNIEQKAIETVLEELENKQDDINILQAQRDSMEYQLNQAKAELGKKDKRLNRQFKLLQKKDNKIEELKADNSHQWEERCKLTFELEKKDKEYEELTEASKELCKTVNLMKKVINEMAEYIHLSGDYECLNKECEDDGDISCEDCIKEYFYKKVKETKDNGSTRNI